MVYSRAVYTWHIYVDLLLDGCITIHEELRLFLNNNCIRYCFELLAGVVVYLLGSTYRLSEC